MSIGFACSLTRLFCVNCCGANADAAEAIIANSKRCMIFVWHCSVALESINSV